MKRCLLSNNISIFIIFHRNNDTRFGIINFHDRAGDPGINHAKGADDFTIHIITDELFERIRQGIEVKENCVCGEYRHKKNAEYLAMRDKSLAEAEQGGFIVKSIAELEEME